MPSSTDRLRAKFFKHDAEGNPTSDGIIEAEYILKKYGFELVDKYWIKWPDNWADPTDPDNHAEIKDAIDWLLDEWDYGIWTETYQENKDYNNQ